MKNFHLLIMLLFLTFALSAQNDGWSSATRMEPGIPSNNPGVHEMWTKVNIEDGTFWVYDPVNLVWRQVAFFDQITPPDMDSLTTVRSIFYVNAFGQPYNIVEFELLSGTKIRDTLATSWNGQYSIENDGDTLGVAVVNQNKNLIYQGNENDFAFSGYDRVDIANTRFFSVVTSGTADGILLSSSSNIISGMNVTVGTSDEVNGNTTVTTRNSTNAPLGAVLQVNSLPLKNEYTPFSLATSSYAPDGVHRKVMTWDRFDDQLIPTFENKSESDFFLTETAISPATPGSPTQLEIVAYVITNSIKDAFIFYNGTDTDNNVYTTAWHVDEANTVNKLPTGSGAVTPTFTWYEGGDQMRAYATYDPFAVGYTENASGDYTFSIPSGQKLDVVEYVVSNSGASQNIDGSSGTTIKITTASGNTNTLNGIIPSGTGLNLSGQLFGLNDVNNGGTSYGVAHAGGTATISINNVTAGFSAGSKLSLINLAQ